MNRYDVLHVRHRAVVDGTGAAVAFILGGGPNIKVTDPEGDELLHVEKPPLDHWYARRPDGEAIIRIDQSFNRFHPITYADGRTAQFEVTGPDWELTAATDGHLLIFTRDRNPLLHTFEWTCSQDGSLNLLDFLATTLTYRELRKLRYRRIQDIP